MVFGLALLLSTPFILKAQASIMELRTGSETISLQNSLDKTSSAVRVVAASGEDARRTFFIELPGSTDSATIVNKTMVYTVSTSSGESQLLRSFEVKIFGNLPADPGRHEITVYHNGTGVVIEPVN